MNIPELVRVGSVDYKVIQSNKTLVLDGNQCKGIIDYDKHTIELDKDVQDIQGLEITFLHELVHAILHDKKLECNNDEYVVDEIAKSLHQVIRDNSNIFKEKAQNKQNVQTEVRAANGAILATISN